MLFPEINFRPAIDHFHFYFLVLCLFVTWISILTQTKILFCLHNSSEHSSITVLVTIFKQIWRTIALLWKSFRFFLLHFILSFFFESRIIHTSRRSIEWHLWERIIKIEPNILKTDIFEWNDETERKTKTSKFK